MFVIYLFCFIWGYIGLVLGLISFLISFTTLPYLSFILGLYLDGFVGRLNRWVSEYLYVFYIGGVLLFLLCYLLFINFGGSILLNLLYLFGGMFFLGLWGEVLLIDWVFYFNLIRGRFLRVSRIFGKLIRYFGSFDLNNFYYFNGWEMLLFLFILFIICYNFLHMGWFWVLGFLSFLTFYDGFNIYRVGRNRGGRCNRDVLAYKYLSCKHLFLGCC